MQSTCRPSFLSIDYVMRRYLMHIELHQEMKIVELCGVDLRFATHCQMVKMLSKDPNVLTHLSFRKLVHKVVRFAFIFFYSEA